MSDAAVRGIVSEVVRRHRQKFSPLPFGRGSERGRGLSVAFVGPAAMRRLNRTYHGEDRVTDVLAFPCGTNTRMDTNSQIRIRGIGDHSWIGAVPEDLGELVVCPSHVRANAKRAGEPFRRELARVLVHGTLHLLGYDHRAPQGAETMFSIQEGLVRNVSFGYKRRS